VSARYLRTGTDFLLTPPTLSAGATRHKIRNLEGGPLSIYFACTYPERASALIAYGSYARWMWDDDYPWGRTDEQFEDFLAGIRQRLYISDRTVETHLANAYIKLGVQSKLELARRADELGI
jgi:hypothetical protein